MSSTSDARKAASIAASNHRTHPTPPTTAADAMDPCIPPNDGSCHFLDLHQRLPSKPKSLTLTSTNCFHFCAHSPPPSCRPSTARTENWLYGSA
jgi:hypothetical protein